MPKRLLIPLFLFAAGLSGCTALQSRSALDLYLKGQLESERGQLPQALASLSAAIKRDPQMGLALIARGDVYKKQGNYEQAADDYKQAIKSEPYNFSAYFNLGLMDEYLKRFEEAVQIFQKAVEIRPLDPDANMNLALSYSQLGQPLNGLFYAQRATEGDPKSAPAFVNLGVLYSQVQFHSAAVDAFKKAIELDSHSPEAYVDLADEYTSNDDMSDEKYDLAANVLESATTLAPSAMVQDRLGYVRFKQKDYGRANEAFQAALKLDPRYYQSLNGLGVVAMSQAILTSPPDVDLAHAAVDDWKKSLGINPDQPKIQELMNKYTPPQ